MFSGHENEPHGFRDSYQWALHAYMSINRYINTMYTYMYFIHI